MARLTRLQAMEHALPRIRSVISAGDGTVYAFADLAQIFTDNKESWLLPRVTTLGDFTSFLQTKSLLLPVDMKLPGRKAGRYISGKVSPAELVLSLQGKSYLTHYTALYFHGLTINIPKTIYTNLEQTPKPSTGASSMNQDSIDLAFSRAMRTTNNIAEFDFDGERYRAFLLNGQFQNRLGVTEIDHEGRKLPITTLERTLIDIAVRPSYAGGVTEVLEAYTHARDRISVNTLMANLQAMKFVYPYHQSIGFYLERAGYKDNVIKLAAAGNQQFDFYLTYQMRNKKYSKRWRLYYPAELD